MEPQCNKWVKGVENFFVITRFCHIKVLFHIYYYWGKENSLLYQGLCYIKVLYIDRGSTVVLNWNFFKKKQKMLFLGD